MREQEWTLVTAAEDVIPMEMGSQLERLPPIQLFHPMDKKDSVIRSIEFKALPERNTTLEPAAVTMNFDKYRRWTLRRNGNIIDRYQSDAKWESYIVNSEVRYDGRQLMIQGQRSTIHLTICDHCNHARVVEIRLPLSMAEYKGGNIEPLEYEPGRVM